MSYGRSHAPSVFGPYHRIESPTQSQITAEQQEHGGLICGKAARGSQIPSVKAYIGPLPVGTRGVEFVTVVRPHALTHPTLVQWYQNDPGVIDGNPGFVCIPVSITLNTQV